MAKTDFSSSSPLAGSFLTGHIHPCPTAHYCGGMALYAFIFCNSGSEEASVQVFLPCTQAYLHLRVLHFNVRR